MEKLRLREHQAGSPQSMLSRISNLLILVVCVLALFSFSLVLFDKGAVLIAEELIEVNSPAPW